VKNGDFQPEIRSMAMERMCSGSIFLKKRKGDKKNIKLCLEWYGTVWYGMACMVFYCRYGMVGIVCYGVYDIVWYGVHGIVW
jgi:hypothetical protein